MSNKTGFSESLSESSEMVSSKLLKTTNNESTKVGEIDASKGSRPLGWETMIQVQSALIERLSAHERARAEEFIGRVIIVISQKISSFRFSLK